MKEQAEKLAEAILKDIVATNNDIEHAIDRLNALYEATGSLGLGSRRQQWSRAVALLQDAQNHIY